MDTASLGEGKFLLAVPDLKLGFESLAHLVRRNVAVRFDGHPRRIDRRHVGLEVTELLMLRRQIQHLAGCTSAQPTPDASWIVCSVIVMLLLKQIQLTPVPQSFVEWTW